MSDLHDALNELAQRGAPRGVDAVLAAASDTAATEAVARDERGDDLDTIPFVTAEPPRRVRRPLGSAIAAAGVAALVLVGAFAVNAVVGGSGAGGGSPEGAVRQLADAVSHEDLLAAANVLAPNEVRSLHGTLVDAENKAADLQLVNNAGSPLAGVDFNVSGLSLSTEKLGADYAKVTINGGTFSASTHKAQFSALMQKVLRNSHDNSASDDLTKLAAGDNLPTFVMVVKDGGRWYVSAAYTVLEYVREANQLPAADFGSGKRSISTLGAASPDDAVQQSMHAIQSNDWSKLLTMVSPSEIPVYDYRAALSTLAARSKTEAPGSAARFTITAMTTASTVSGNTAQVTLKASGTTSSGKWSLDGGCFTLPQESVSITCSNGTRLGILDLPTSGFSQDAHITVVKDGGRWFVSPVGTVLDVVDQFISSIDRRSLYTLLGVPNELPPDGVLTLGRPVVLPTNTLFGERVLSFKGSKGESLLGQVTSKAPAPSVGPDGINIDEFPGAEARVYAADGSELENDDGLLNGQALVLPADGTYIFVFQTFGPPASGPTVTIWNSADAPAAAHEPTGFGSIPGGGTCTYTNGGEMCSSSSSPTTFPTGTIPAGLLGPSGAATCPGGKYRSLVGPHGELLGPDGKPVLGSGGTPLTVPAGFDPGTLKVCAANGSIGGSSIVSGSISGSSSATSVATPAPTVVVSPTTGG